MGGWDSGDRARWIRNKIAQKNRFKATLPVFEYNLGKTCFGVLGDTEIEWILRCRGESKKTTGLIKKSRRRMNIIKVQSELFKKATNAGVAQLVEQ